MFNIPALNVEMEAYLIIDGSKYQIEQFSMGFNQPVDYKGQPQNEVKGGQILVTITQTVPEEIYKWAMTSIKKNGEIKFKSMVVNSPLKVSFTNGYCVNFSRITEVSGGIKTSLTISSESITINDITFTNNWVN
jgi:hypothetical protein